VRRLAEETGAEVTLREVETLEQALAERFLVSPSVRVDGRDIEPAPGQRTDYGLKCRLYRAAEGHRPIPPERWIRDALGRPHDDGTAQQPA
jgi:hypothetical protein